MKLKIPFNVYAKQILVALDDGHGEDTAGKRTPFFPEGGFMHENEFNERVVELLDVELKRCGFGTLLVAPTDDDTPLSVRVKRAKDAKVDIYLSIHANAFKGVWGNAKGIETLTSGKGESLRIGKILQAELLKGTKLPDRGMKDGSWLGVIKGMGTTPAILVECGFMDNLAEARLLKTESYRKECAVELAKGLCVAYKVKYVPYVAPKPKPVAPKPVAQKPAPKTLYRVQVGAFGLKPNADVLAKELKGKGFETSVVVSGKLFKVQTGAFGVKANAIALEAKLKKAGYKPFITS